MGTISLKPNKILFVSVAAAISLFGLGLLFDSPVQALSGSQFQAGRIIDDGVFFNPNSMSAQDVQNFLNAKMPNCDTWGQQTIYDSAHGDTVTRATYSQRRGISTPFTCLKDYWQNIPGADADNYCHNWVGAGNKSAAQIIKDVSMACGISPQVFIVLLQKEQNLVTDDWPWPVQYRSATGYGCPDTAACDSQYYGFFNQVYNAAHQYKVYAQRPDLFPYSGGTTRNILYNPNTACGSSPVYLQNQATAGLYYYTPYQPNAAALNNLYGTGDGCSAYGNRNFWRLFNDWFGTTYAANYFWFYESHSFYTDSTKTTSVDPMHLTPGQKIYVELRGRNEGVYTWYKDGSAPMRLGTSNPQDRLSIFCDSATWLSCSRPAAMSQDSVSTGSLATFDFWLKAPSPPGNYNEYFNLVADGYTWLNDNGFYLTMNVDPVYTWQYVGQNAYYDQAMTQPADTNNLSPGQRIFLTLTAKNTGNIAWSNSGANPVFLAGANPNDRVSRLCDSSWTRCSRPALLNESSVAPGDNGTFGFWANAPTTTGTYNEFFNLVTENFAWFNNLGLFYTLKVNPASYTWSWVSQGAYTGSGPLNGSLSRGDLVYLTLAAKNTGNTTWYRGGTAPLRLGTSNPYGRTSWFCYSTWISCQRAVPMQEAAVPPGQTAHFIFTAHAPPDVSGDFNEYFNLIAENLTWLNNLGLHYSLNVQ